MALFNRNAPISNIGSEESDDLSPQRLEHERVIIAVMRGLAGSAIAYIALLAFIAIVGGGS